MRRKQRQKITRNKEKKGYLQLFVVVIFLLFIISTIFVTVQTASLGATISELERQETAYIKENREMESALVNNQSLMKLDEKAAELGYVKPNDIIYLSRDNFVAQLR